MFKSKFWNQLIIFVIAIITILIAREYFSNLLIEKGIKSYQTHTFLNIGSNLLLILVSIVLIQNNGISEIAGIKRTKLKRWYLLLFPLVYLVLLNGLSIDEMDREPLISNILVFAIYSLSIGFAEELSLRGFLQSYLIKHLGTTKRNIVLSVLISSLFFGLLHLINFDNGFYGELSQVMYATFIGVMFGVLLVITKRIYPLIIIHAIIDFVGDFDTIGLNINNTTSESSSLESATLIALLVSPCLLYGVSLIRKYPLQDNIEE
ncbi:CPBP family intramembrane metalloprotease [Aquimarina sp. MMG015]|uniref:CPBP family intramembrane glutamic endopeptidase n=1 Tax=Aquimarina sp. MMG015 TaxID=2822689 RepID=UPI001B3A7A0C|nr:CPBP family intramembrane glutamic endopeptidase [Aquimarina sp. MMG015]MBQ4802526.1 CPBP family intramembrane metalloprotease [Aquimarina sp. MMG015]